MTDTQHTPTSQLDLAGGSEEERLAAHVADLRHSIEEAAYQYYVEDYYVEDNPRLSDAEYDQLMLELQRIEREHPELQSLDSPTQRVGGGGAAPVQDVPHHRHPPSMLSLANARARLLRLPDWLHQRHEREQSMGGTGTDPRVGVSSQSPHSTGTHAR